MIDTYMLVSSEICSFEPRKMQFWCRIVSTMGNSEGGWTDLYGFVEGGNQQPVAEAVLRE